MLVKSQQASNLRWQEWIKVESTRRYLYAAFICSNLLVVTYDLQPGFGITQDLEFGLFEEEKLWGAPTTDDWEALRVSRSLPPTKTIRSFMEDFLTGMIDNNTQAPYYVSELTSFVIIHAVNMYAQNLSQITCFSSSKCSDNSGVTHNAMLNALANLSRCRKILDLARPGGIEYVWNEPDDSLLPNCKAMLRVAYTRLFLQARMPDNILQLGDCPEGNEKLLMRFVDTRQERGPVITEAMLSMHEAFSLPAKAGCPLVQKIAAIRWSVEHAVAGWGCGKSPLQKQYTMMGLLTFSRGNTPIAFSLAALS